MVDERKLIAKLEDMVKESKEESGLKEPALLRKVIEEVKSMAVNEEIKARIEREEGTMTMTEAIVHAKEKAEKLNGTCAREHYQLAKWLEELQQYRDKVEKVNRQLAVSDRWIPVLERLPEKDDVYICTLSGELCGIDAPFTGMCGLEDEKWDEEGCVIAWMPLPEPYKGE